MGHIRRRRLDRGGAAYLARYRGPDGREHSKQFAKRSDAERYLAVAEVSRADGSWVDPTRARMPLRDWVIRFQEAQRQALRPSTLARDEVYVRTQILPAFGDVPLVRIEHEAVQRWVNGLSTRLAPTTAHKCYQILRKTLAAAVRSRLLVRNPCQGVQLPRVEREEMRFIGPAEIRRLAQTIDERYHGFVLLGAYGGLRLGEMAGLRWRRVDLLGGRVEVAETSVEINGAITFGPPKTRAGHRTVAIPELVVRALQAARASVHEPDALVFRAPDGGPLQHRLFRRRFWYPAVADSGLEAAGIEQFGRPSDPEVAEARPLVPLGVVAGRFAEGVTGHDGESIIVFGNSGGLVTGPEVINDLCEVQVANNREKLGDAGHLFVWIDSLAGQEWVAMDLNRPPRERPALIPPGITIWIARQRETGTWEPDRLWRLSPSRSWETVDVA